MANRKNTAEKVNKYGVKVGDIFSASWGWEQTNVDFFQVVALAGETSVRVREVCLPMIEDKAVSDMSAERVYQLSGDMLPAVPRSTYIRNQEKGDLKRVFQGHYSDREKTMERCYLKIDSCANAYKCSGNTVKTYESWYY